MDKMQDTSFAMSSVIGFIHGHIPRKVGKKIQTDIFLCKPSDLSLAPGTLFYEPQRAIEE